MNPELTLRGLYEGPDESSLFFHWEYFNEGMNNASFCVCLHHQSRQVRGGGSPGSAKKSTPSFRTRPRRPKTETEKAFVLGFISMMGNVQLLITSICSGVIFAIVLVAANTMAMSIRERTREIGILKALGFRTTPRPVSLVVGGDIHYAGRLSDRFLGGAPVVLES